MTHGVYQIGVRGVDWEQVRTEALRLRPTALPPEVERRLAKQIRRTDREVERRRRRAPVDGW